MVSETFPIERICTVMGSTVIFYAIVYQVTRWVTARIWKGWDSLSNSKKRDFAGRFVSMSNGIICTYTAYYNLHDPRLLADKVYGVTDGMQFTSSVVGGYILYDTVFVLMNWENEKHAGGPLTLVHHVVVSSMLPVGLYFNTAGWMGSGVLAFWTEITNVNQNMIWVLRTLVGTNSIIYMLNGFIFAVSFLLVRTVIMGYYTYLWYLDVMDNHRDVCMTPGTACNFAVWEAVFLYTVGLLWTHPVVAKAGRAIQAYRKNATEDALAKSKRD